MVIQHANNTIEFRLYCGKARSVNVAGDFNDWDVHRHPMFAHGNGCWSCRLRLPPGTFQFRYYTDGEWFIDYAELRPDRGPCGWNSVVHVPTPAEVAV